MCRNIFQKLESLCFQLIKFHIIQIHPHSHSLLLFPLKNLFTKLQCILFCVGRTKRSKKNTKTFMENLS